MVRGTDSGPLLGPSYQLPGGPRARLRVARPSDAAGIRRLLADLGVELDLLPLLRFDPRRRIAVCASALVGSSEVILGVGAIDLDGSEPDALIVDERQAPGLSDLLHAALLGRAAASQRARAA